MSIGAARGVMERLHGGGARAAGIAVRVAAAILGGYALAALCSVALAVTLPMARADAVLTGMMAGLAVHAAAVVWAFAARNAARAWAGLLVAALPLGAAALLGQWYATGWILP